MITSVFILKQHFPGSYRRRLRTVLAERDSMINLPHALMHSSIYLFRYKNLIELLQ